MTIRYRVIGWTDTGSSALVCGLNYPDAREQAEFLRSSGFRNVCIHAEGPSLAHVRLPKSEACFRKDLNTEE